MSFGRKARRNAIKKNPMTAEQADKIIAIESNKKTAREIAEDYFEKKKEALKNDTVGEMMILFCGYLRINLNFNRRNLQDFVTDFTRFFSLASNEQTTFKEIGDLLEEEVEFNIEKEFALASKLVEAEENNFNELREKCRRQQLQSVMTGRISSQMKKEDKRYETADEN